MPFHKGISNNYHLSQDNATFQIITNFKLFIGHLKFEIRNWKFQLGFSLIELMIVVSLFGVAASLVTASYLNFEKNSRVRSAATALKNDLRLVQNKATSGDKGPSGVSGSCPETSTLGGWFLRIQSGATQTAYTIGGVCLSPVIFAESSFERRTINLPKDLIINRFAYDTTNNQTAAIVIFFRPLVVGLSYLSAASALPTDDAPNFFDDKGVYFKNKEIIPYPVSPVTIEFSDATVSKTYHLCIKPTGEVNELKPGGSVTCQNQ